MTYAMTFLAMMIGQTPDVPGTWGHKITADVKMSQLSLSSWAQGGEESLSWQGQFRGLSTLRDSKTLDWAWKYEVSFGQSKSGDRGLRKTDDRLIFETTIVRKLGLFVNPYVAAALRTQFRPGYKYTPHRTVSKFFDPAYLTQSAGGGIDLGGGTVKTRLGLALREVVTRKFTSYSDDPSTPEVEDIDVQGGAESVTEIRLPLTESSTLTAQLKLFRKFDDFGNMVMNSDTQLRVELAKYVILTAGVELIDDERSSDKLQAKQTLSLGLGYRFK